MSETWFNVKDMLPRPGEAVMVQYAVGVKTGTLMCGERTKIIEMCVARAHFTGLQYRPGDYCRGVFRIMLNNPDVENYVTAELWKPRDGASLAA